MNKIYCLGDSHAVAFCGKNPKKEPSNTWLNTDGIFFANRLGPLLAYNAINKMDLIFNALADVPHNSNVMLCFGEIDCRAHIKKQSEIQNKPVEDIIIECVDRYIEVVLQVYSAGFRVFVWNAPPPLEDIDNAEFPSHGTCAERRYITEYFNEYLKSKCLENNFIFISIYDHLVDEFQTKREYFMDRVHLDTTAVMPLIKQKLNHYLFADNKLELFCDKAAFEFCKSNQKTGMVIIWPVAIRNDLQEKILDSLNNFSDIAYVKEFTLSKNGGRNLLKQIHYGKVWWDVNIESELDKRFLDIQDNPVIAVVFKPRQISDIRRWKKEFRNTLGLAKSSYHVTDPDCLEHLGIQCTCELSEQALYAETLKHAKLILNDNSIHYLNYSSGNDFDKFKTLFSKYVKWIEQNDLVSGKFCLDNGAVLSAYGIRDVHDLDFLFAENSITTGLKDIDCHNGHFNGILKQNSYDFNRLDVINNPKYHFYYQGYKIISLEAMTEIKQKRLVNGKRRFKDAKDVYLINRHINQLRNKNKLLILSTDGGLGNRLRTVAIYKTIADFLGRELKLYWPPNPREYNIKFEELFANDFLISEQEYENYKQNKQNLFIEINYGVSPNAEFGGRGGTDPLYYQDKYKINLLENLDNNVVIVNTFVKFYPDFIENEVFEHLFSDSLQKLIPQKGISNCVNRFVEENFKYPIIGLHVRRSDRDECKIKSPDELYIKLIDYKLKKNSGYYFYLATDSKETEANLKNRYGSKIITLPKKFDMPNWERPTSVQDALIEMLILARTGKIYGSYSSSFGFIASKFGGIPFFELTLDTVEGIYESDLKNWVAIAEKAVSDADNEKLYYCLKELPSLIDFNIQINFDLIEKEINQDNVKSLINKVKEYDTMNSKDKVEYFAQIGQDKILDEELFFSKRNGVFIEVGACDGSHFSNTLFFEKYRDWQGICVEPNPIEFAKLEKSGRKAHLEQCAVALKEDIVDFLAIDGYGRGLSGMVDTYDQRHVERIDSELAGRTDSKRHMFKVKTQPLKSIIDKYGYTYVDFCSIDVEGAELEVLQSIDFDKVFIRVIMLENNYGLEREHELLVSKGYRLWKKIQWDDIYVKDLTADIEERFMRSALYDFIRSNTHNPVIVEIGSYDCKDGLELLVKCNASKVYSIEADPRNYTRCLENIKGHKNIECFNYAIGDKDGFADFYLSSGRTESNDKNYIHSASSSLKPPTDLMKLKHPWLKFEEKAKVKIITLDSFCALNNIDHIDLLWMDVQGAEDLVLSGATNILAKTKYLFTEYSNTKIYKDALNADGVINKLGDSWHLQHKFAFDILLQNIDLINNNCANPVFDDYYYQYIVQQKSLELKKNISHPKTTEVNDSIFSVIMANYNGGKYIQQAIVSVIAQTFKNWELIIIDDGSIDNSVEIINSFTSDKRIRFIKHPVNKGYTEALLTGVKHSQSEFIGTLDSDDLLMPNAIEVMVKAHLEHKDKSFICSQFVSIDENSKPLRYGFCLPLLPLRTNLDSDCLSHFKTFKKSFYQTTSGFNVDFFAAEDKDVFYKLEEVGGIYYVNKILYQYRVLADSQSHQPEKWKRSLISWSKARGEALYRRYANSIIKMSEYFSLFQNQIYHKNEQIENRKNFDYHLLSRIDNRRIKKPDTAIVAIITEYRDVVRLINEFTKNSKETIVIDLRVAKTELAEISGLNILYLMMPDYIPVWEAACLGARCAKADSVMFALVNKVVQISDKNTKLITLNDFRGVSADAICQKISCEIVLDYVVKTHKDTNLPLVSVILPTMNRIENLICALLSIEEQTYSNIEVVLVNDGGLSLDELVQKGQMNFKFDLKYIELEKNSERCVARNKGIEASKGKYICYLDDDDKFYPEHISTLVEALESNNGYVAYSNTNKAYRQKDQSGDYQTINSELAFSVDFDKERLFIENYIPILCLMHRKDCLQQSGAFDPDVLRTEDWDLWMRLAMHYPFIHVNKVTSEYSWVDDGSTSMSGDKEPFAWAYLNMFYKYKSYSETKSELKDAHYWTVLHNVRLLKEYLEIAISKKIENFWEKIKVKDKNYLLKRLEFLHSKYPIFSKEFIQLIGLAKGLSENTHNNRTLEKKQDENLKLIAFYLPQFHPTPENNQWWGKGFTEWTNVAKAKPLFKEHHQPQLPSDLGFYDLRLSEVREEQAKMAKEHHISGFCYWHYWLNGKRLLETPFNQMLESGKPDFPFCLAWANETWSRRWLGEEKEILLKQTYSEQDDFEHILWLVNVFKDKRNITIKGRPLFLIYRPKNLPNALLFTKILRDECVKAGLLNPYLVGINGHAIEDYRKFGFDATLMFMPQLGCLPESMNDNSSATKKARNQMIGVNSDKLKLYDYSESVKLMQDKKHNLNYPVISTVLVGWDNTARRGENGVVLVNSSPQAYKQHLVEILQEQNQQCESSNLVFINAWNEWAEGNHLEPDHKHGKAFLEATKSAYEENCLQKDDRSTVKTTNKVEEISTKAFFEEDQQNIGDNYYYTLYNPGKALLAYQQAFKENPQNEDLILSLAMLLSGNGEIKAASELISYLKVIVKDSLWPSWYEKYVLKNASSFNSQLKRLSELVRSNSSLQYSDFHSFDELFWFWMNTIGRKKYPQLLKLLPGLPSDEIQITVGGSCGDNDMWHGFRKYRIFRELHDKYRNPRNPVNKILDFGCAYGRMLRYFVKDFHSAKLYGSDIWESLIKWNKENSHYAEFLQGTVFPPSGIAENTFDLIYSFSVFSHLSAENGEAWLKELARITAENGLIIVTIWSHPLRTKEYHNNHFEDYDKLVNDYDAGNFCYSTLKYSPKAVYAEALIPKSYIRRVWSQYVDILEIVEGHPWSTNQSYVVMRKKSNYASAIAEISQNQNYNSLAYTNNTFKTKEFLVILAKGEQLFNSGRLEESKQYFEEMAVLYQDSFEVANNLGVVCEALGYKSDAISWFRKAININPDYKTAKENLDNLLMLKR